MTTPETHLFKPWLLMLLLINLPLNDANKLNIDVYCYKVSIKMIKYVLVVTVLCIFSPGTCQYTSFYDSSSKKVRHAVPIEIDHEDQSYKHTVLQGYHNVFFFWLFITGTAFDIRSITSCGNGYFTHLNLFKL